MDPFATAALLCDCTTFYGVYGDPTNTGTGTLPGAATAL